MTTLDEIQARFERGDEALDAYGEGRGASSTAMVRMAGSIADVPKLVVALREVETIMDQLDIDRADGRLVTIGEIQQAVRGAIQQALDG